MSCTSNPVFKSLSTANGCLLSPPAIFSTKNSYPNLSLPTKSIKLHLSCAHSHSSSLPSSFTFKKRIDSLTLVTFVAQSSGWAQQEGDSSVAVENEEAEFSWGENQEVGEAEAGASAWGGKSEAVGDSGGEEEFAEEEQPYREPSEEAKVFVGNIPYDIDSEKLAQLFEKAGIVEISEVIYNRDTDQSRGFGFVTMSTVEEAEKAVEMFNRYDINGRLLTVTKAAPRGSRPERTQRTFEPSFRLYVGNLPWDADNARLEQIFSEYGKVVDARVVSDRETGRSRGFGFVTMSTEAEVSDAIENLDGQEMGGRPIRVNVAQERPRRSAF